MVEDEPLISLDITARLQGAGARVVSASHLEKALGLAECPNRAAGVLEARRSPHTLRVSQWPHVQRVPAVAPCAGDSEAGDTEPDRRGRRAIPLGAKIRLNGGKKAPPDRSCGETGARGRFRIEGPEAYIEGNGSLLLALALHELATNAVKHGALSNGAGKVSVTWSLEEQRVLLRWQETDGPP